MRKWGLESFQKRGKKGKGGEEKRKGREGKEREEGEKERKGRKRERKETFPMVPGQKLVENEPTEVQTTAVDTKKGRITSQSKEKIR